MVNYCFVSAYTVAAVSQAQMMGITKQHRSLTRNGQVRPILPRRCHQAKQASWERKFQWSKQFSHGQHSGQPSNHRGQPQKIQGFNVKLTQEQQYSLPYQIHQGKSLSLIEHGLALQLDWSRVFPQGQYPGRPPNVSHQPCQNPGIYGQQQHSPRHQTSQDQPLSLTECGLHLQLGWSTEFFDGQYLGKPPNVSHQSHQSDQTCRQQTLGQHHDHPPDQNRQHKSLTELGMDLQIQWSKEYPRGQFSGRLPTCSHQKYETQRKQDFFQRLYRPQNQSNQGHSLSLDEYGFALQFQWSMEISCDELISKPPNLSNQLLVNGQRLNGKQKSSQQHLNQTRHGRSLSLHKNWLALQCQWSREFLDCQFSGPSPNESQQPHQTQGLAGQWRQQRWTQPPYIDLNQTHQPRTLSIIKKGMALQRQWSKELSLQPSPPSKKQTFENMGLQLQLKWAIGKHLLPFDKCYYL